MKKVATTHRFTVREEQPDWGYTSHFMAHGSFERIEEELPEVTHEGVRFRVTVDETPFEFTITRQALEDLDHSRAPQGDLLEMFLRNREPVEAIALERIEAGARWPHLVIRMQDVEAFCHS